MDVVSQLKVAPSESAILLFDILLMCAQSHNARLFEETPEGIKQCVWELRLKVCCTP